MLNQLTLMVSLTLSQAFGIDGLYPLARIAVIVVPVVLYFLQTHYAPVKISYLATIPLAERKGKTKVVFDYTYPSGHGHNENQTVRIVAVYDAEQLRTLEVFTGPGGRELDLSYWSAGFVRELKDAARQEAEEQGGINALRFVSKNVMDPDATTVYDKAKKMAEREGKLMVDNPDKLGSFYRKPTFKNGRVYVTWRRNLHRVLGYRLLAYTAEMNPGESFPEFDINETPEPVTPPTKGWTGLWYGGSNYAAPEGTDVERFDTLPDAKEWFEDRLFYSYTPCVERVPSDLGGPTLILFMGSHSDTTDMHPDKMIEFGPKGGVVLSKV